MDQSLSVDGSVGRLWSLVLADHLMMIRFLYPDVPTTDGSVDPVLVFHISDLKCFGPWFSN